MAPFSAASKKSPDIPILTQPTFSLSDNNFILEKETNLTVADEPNEVVAKEISEGASKSGIKR